MGTSYDPTTYLNQQATIAPFTSRVASAAGRLRSSRVLGGSTPHRLTRVDCRTTDQASRAYGRGPGRGRGLDRTRPRPLCFSPFPLTACNEPCLTTPKLRLWDAAK